MGCAIRITALLVVFCTHIFIAYGSVQSIWSNPEVAENILGSFTEYLLESGIFSSEQIDDIASISQTILNAFGRSGFSNNISRTKMQALNMAFASSVAEIAVSENSLVPLSVAINIIIDALRNSMLKNTGGVDEFFLKEINQLINMIATDRLNEDSDVSGVSEETQNVSDVTANARGYDPSSRTSSQGYRSDTRPNDGYNARASGAESPFQQYRASQPTEVVADTRHSQGFNDVAYRPANAQAFSQNVGLNAFGNTGDLGFGQDSTAVAFANALNYSDYYKQSSNRQAYPMATDRAPGDAGRDVQGFQESGYTVDIINGNKATEFGQGDRDGTEYAKAKGFPQGSSDSAAAKNIRQGYRNNNKGRVYSARKDSSIPTYATANATPSLSGDTSFYDVSYAPRRANNGGNDREIISSSRDIDVISKFTSTITSSLLSSNDFTSTFRSGLPVTNAVNLASNLARSFANQIGLDDTAINSLLSLVSQYISELGSSADVSVYANAISRAIGDTLQNTDNISVLTASLATADTKPIANLVNSVTSATVSAQQPNLVRRGGGSNLKNLPANQVQGNLQNLDSVQSAVGTRIQPNLSRFPGQSANAVASRGSGAGQAAEITSATGDIDVISQFTNTITSSLLSSNDFTSTFGSGLPVTTALNLASNLAQTLATQIGLDEAAINSLLSLLGQYISAIDSSADASAYANALSLAIGNTLANIRNVSPVLTASLASADTQPIANLVSSVTSSTLNAQQTNINRSGRASTFRNVPLTQVQENRGNIGSVQSVVGRRFQPSLTRFPEQNAAATAGAGVGQSAAASAGAGVGEGAGTSGIIPNIDVISKFTNTITSSLLSSNDFTSIFGGGLPVTTALNLASNIAQSLATQIGLDEAGINSLLSLLSQYISAIGPAADASAYANALSLAIGNTLANTGNLSPVLTASLASVDTQQVANLVNSVTSSTLNAQQSNLVRTGGRSTLRNAAATQVQGNHENLVSVQGANGRSPQPSLSTFPGQGASAAVSAAAGDGQGIGTSSTATDTDVISQFTNTITSSLLSSNDFTSTFGSGLPVTTALNLASNLAQTLATQIGLDEAAINSLLSLLGQYISAIDSSADASAYANALSLAIGNVLANTGNVSPVLTANLASADTQPIANLVSSVTSSTLNAQQPNTIRSGVASTFRKVPLTQVQRNSGNLSAVQSLVGRRLQPSLTRFSGQSAAASAAAGAGTSSTATNIDVISKFTKTISSGLLASNDFTSIFGSGLPITNAINLASNIAQSLATQIGLDEAGINSLLSLLSQYISAIGSSTDASAYANALSLAIGNTLANAGNVSPVLIASLASADTQPVSNLVSSVTSSTLNAQQPNVIRSGGTSAFRNVPLTQVQGNRGNLGSVQSSVGTSLQPSLSRFLGQNPTGSASSAAQSMQGAGTSGTTPNIDVISKFTNTIASSLLSSNDFTSTFGSGLPVTTALNLASHLAQSLGTQIGLDKAGINSLLSSLSQYISAIGPAADASAYANALSLAIGNTLANSEIVSPVLTASLASADTEPVTTLVSSVTSNSLKSQQPNLIRSGGASTFRNAPLTQVQGNRGNLGSVQSLVGRRFQPSLMRFLGQNAAATAGAGVGQGAGTSGTIPNIDVISKFTNTITSSLLSSNDFTSIFGGGLPVTTALNLASNIAQSLVTQIGLDEAAINSLLSLLGQYISAIGPAADASSYANALSLAIGNTLANAGNISPILTASLASTDIQPIANLVNSVTSSTLNTQLPNLIRRGGGSGLGSAVNSRLSRPGLITASLPVSSATGAAISESGLIGQVNVNPSAVSTAGIGNLAVSSATTSPSVGLGGGSVSLASDVGSPVVSAPSSVSPSARISSAASSLVSGKSFNPNALPSVISYLANQVSASAANLSDCEIMSQVLLETLSAVTHLLRYAVIDEVNYSDLANTASFIGQALG